jgi:hypothetical protein
VGVGGVQDSSSSSALRVADAASAVGGAGGVGEGGGDVKGVIRGKGVVKESRMEEDVDTLQVKAEVHASGEDAEVALGKKGQRAVTGGVGGGHVRGHVLPAPVPKRGVGPAAAMSAGVTALDPNVGCTPEQQPNAPEISGVCVCVCCVCV